MLTALCPLDCELWNQRSRERKVKRMWIWTLILWLARKFLPVRAVGDHLDKLVVQKDFVTAVGCVREVVAAAQRKSTHQLGYSVQCALNALSYGGYITLGDGIRPPVGKPHGSKLTHFLRYILPILKRWIEKLLPDVFTGGMRAAPALTPEELMTLEQFLAMPDDA
jgi:hypothetical protein